MTEREVRRWNQRFGWWLFLVYLALYLGFVTLAAFSPASLEWRPGGGLNLALLYGFGLIFAALILALVYGVLCRTANDRYAATDRGGKSTGGAPR